MGKVNCPCASSSDVPRGYMNIEDAARSIRMNPKTLYNRATLRQVVFHKIPGRNGRFFRRQDLEKLGKPRVIRKGK